MTTPVGDIHHVGIMVADLDQAERFVTTAFGFPVVNRIASEEHGMRAVFVSCGSALVELVEFSDSDLVRERLGDRVAAIDHLAFQVDDVEAAAEALAESGVETVTPAPVALPSGRTYFTKGDTSGGIIWQLLELA